MHALKVLTSHKQVHMHCANGNNGYFGRITFYEDAAYDNTDSAEWEVMDDAGQLTYLQTICQRDTRRDNVLICYQLDEGNWLISYISHGEPEIKQLVLFKTDNLFEHLDALHDLDERIMRTQVPSKFNYSVYNAWVNHE